MGNRESERRLNAFRGDHFPFPISDSPQAYSTLMFAALITFAHFFVSLLM
jgi:hypothetical protein